MCHLQGQVLKGIVASTLLSLVSVTLEEASRHVVRTLKQPYGEMHVAKNQGLSPTDGKGLRPPANSHLNLQMISANGIDSYPALQTHLP